MHVVIMSGILCTLGMFSGHADCHGQFIQCQCQLQARQEKRGKTSEWSGHSTSQGHLSNSTAFFISCFGKLCRLIVLATRDLSNKNQLESVSCVLFVKAKKEKPAEKEVLLNLVLNAFLPPLFLRKFRCFYHHIHIAGIPPAL